MKKQLLIAAAVVAGISAHAQKGLLESKHTQTPPKPATEGKTNADLFRITGAASNTYDGAIFVKDDSIQFTYSGIRGGVIVINPYSAVFNPTPVVKPDLQMFYNYNTGTASWENSNQTTLTYDTKHNILTSTSQNWNNGTNSWENSNKTSNTYDGSNNLTEALDQSWNGANWDNSYRNVNTFNGGNEMTDMVRQNWSGGAWVNSYKVLYTYTAGRQETVTQQTWTGGAWVNANKVTYMYSGTNTIPDSKVEQLWSGGAWNNYSKNTYTSGSGTFTDIGQNWSGGAWVNTAKNEYTVDGNGNVTSVISQEWDAGNWKNTTKIIYSYNTNNLISLYETQKWNAGNFWEVPVGGMKQAIYYESYTNSVAGIDAQQGNLKVYPNPAINAINVSMEWNNAQPFTVTVYDMQGRVVKQFSEAAAKSYNKSISTNDLSFGSYMLVIKSAEGQTSSVFSVIK